MKIILLNLSRIYLTFIQHDSCNLSLCPRALTYDAKLRMVIVHGINNNSLAETLHCSSRRLREHIDYTLKSGAIIHAAVSLNSRLHIKTRNTTPLSEPHDGRVSHATMPKQTRRYVVGSGANIAKCYKNKSWKTDAFTNRIAARFQLWLDCHLRVRFNTVS